MDISDKELGAATDFCVDCLEILYGEDAAEKLTAAQITNSFRAAFRDVARQKGTASVACKMETMVPVTTSLTSSSCHSERAWPWKQVGLVFSILFSNYMKCGERILEIETQLCPLTVQTQ